MSRLPDVLVWKDGFSSSLHRPVILLLHQKSDSTCHVTGKEGVPEVKDFFAFDNSRELKDVKLIGYEHLGKVPMEVSI